MKLPIYCISICDFENHISKLKQKYPWIDWFIVTLEIVGLDRLRIYYNQNTYNPNGPAIDLNDYSIYFSEEK